MTACDTQGAHMTAHQSRLRHTALKPLIRAPLLGCASIVMLRKVVKLTASQTFKHRPRLLGKL
jgi:hypothetical protein